MTAIAPANGEELAKARSELAALGVDVAVLSSVANVTYVCGVEVPVPVGAGAELTFAPWLAVIGVRDGAAALVAPTGAVPDGAASGFEIIGFDTFDSFRSTDPRESYLAALRSALILAGAANGSCVVGIETRSLPFAAAEVISAGVPNATIVDAEAAIRAARAVKTGREIALLRRCAHLADIAHVTLAELCREAGRTEFAMFGEIGARIFAAAGRDIPLSGELVTGPRTTSVHYPNGPRERVTEVGDAALMDLSGRCDGYWFDCTNTHVVGGVEPSASQRRHARASQDACEAAMAALRPGGKASDPARAAEAAFARHGLPMAHYAGHQIGVAVNEPPRLVAYDDTRIRAGMVFAVEPGAYEGPGGSFGARSEKMVLVTPSGPEILSTFEWGI